MECINVLSCIYYHVLHLCWYDMGERTLQLLSLGKVINNNNINNSLLGGGSLCCIFCDWLFYNRDITILVFLTTLNKRYSKQSEIPDICRSYNRYSTWYLPTHFDAWNSRTIGISWCIHVEVISSFCCLEKHYISKKVIWLLKKGIK